MFSDGPAAERPEAPDRRRLAVEQVLEAQRREAVSGDRVELGAGERPGQLALGIAGIVRWGVWGLNPGPTDYESAALTD